MKKITLNNLQDVFASKVISLETAELKGYELIEELFCDSSGFSASNEAALTKSQLETKLIEILKDNPTVYACVTRQGMFQVYVGIFKKAAKKISKVIAGNTLEIVQGEPHMQGTKRIIRLYDTNIITFEGHKITLNNGGYPTRTTHRRMNDNLPAGFGGVYAKGGESWLDRHGKQIPFVNGELTIQL